MGQAETNVTRRWQLRNSKFAVLFRRQVGVFFTRGTAKPKQWVDESGNRMTLLTNSQMVNMGIKGQYDWDGWHTMVVTPEMVGKKVAVYTAVEFKSEDGRVSAEQRHYGNTVKMAGGIAGVVNDENQPPPEWEAIS